MTNNPINGVLDQSIDGVTPDLRSPDDKAKDFNHLEIAQAVQLNWNRDVSGAPKYSIRNQDGSSSCVGQSTAKALEIITEKIQSAHPIYRRRANYPSPGMYLQDAFNS